MTRQLELLEICKPANPCGARVSKSQDGEGTSREVGVNLKQGYNGDLTSREAGSVGGQMVKKMTTIRTMSYMRQNRTAIGHQWQVIYQADVCL